VRELSARNLYGNVEPSIARATYAFALRAFLDHFGLLEVCFFGNAVILALHRTGACRLRTLLNTGKPGRFYTRGYGAYLADGHRPGSCSVKRYSEDWLSAAEAQELSPTNLGEF
jgi:hypothetical protein